MSSLEPVVFRAQAFKMHDAGFRPMNRSAYSFLKQDEGNPKKKYYSGRHCKYDQHSKNFLHVVKIHCKLHQAALLMTARVSARNCQNCQWAQKVLR